MRGQNVAINKQSDIRDILKRAKADNVRFVSMQFSDITGMAKSVVVPAEQLRVSLTDGVWFDGSSIQGFVRIFESDQYLVPDIRTYAILPWFTNGRGRTARFICDVYTADGKAFGGDPRAALKRVMKEARGMGFAYNTGPELEFFLFKKEDGKLITATGKHPEMHDRGEYFDLVLDEASHVKSDMMGSLQQMGINVEASHHEVAAGQHEIDFRYADALTTSDNALTLKYALKSVAAQHGLHATFMPKPIEGINGSGMHIHQSLFYTKNGRNAFYDAKDKYKLSKVAYHFMAGQMHFVSEFIALLAPLVNSYKRLVPGYEAATYISWAQINRSALIRIPRTTPGRDKAVRIEIRCADPTANTYLAFAALLKAGLEGIKKKMMPPKPNEENVFSLTREQLDEKKIGMLPQSLWHAMENLKKSRLVRDAIGDHIFLKFIEMKDREWDSFRLSVTDWEREKYLETY